MSTAAATPATAAITSPSSSKRPASASTSTPAAKRARPSTDKAAEQLEDDDEDKPAALEGAEENDEDEEDMGDEAKAKAARREARVSCHRLSSDPMLTTSLSDDPQPRIRPAFPQPAQGSPCMA